MSEPERPYSFIPKIAREPLSFDARKLLDDNPIIKETTPVRTSVIQFIEDDKFEPTGSRVLIQAISDKEARQSQISLPGTEHEDKNVSWYIVKAVGPKVKTTKVGDRILHISAAADKVIAKYGCIKERYIICYLRD